MLPTLVVRRRLRSKSFCLLYEGCLEHVTWRGKPPLMHVEHARLVPAGQSKVNEGLCPPTQTGAQDACIDLYVGGGGGAGCDDAEAREVQGGKVYGTSAWTSMPRQLGMRAENIERLLERYFGPKGFYSVSEPEQVIVTNKGRFYSLVEQVKQRFQQTTSRTKRSTKQLSSTLKRATKSLGPDYDDNHIDLDLSAKLFGSEVGWKNLGGDIEDFTPEQAINKVFNTIDEGIKKSRDVNIDMRNHGTFMEVEMIYPIAWGVPLKMLVSGSAALHVKVNSNLDLVTLVKDYNNVDMRFNPEVREHMVLENRGNFLQPVELILKYDPVLREHLIKIEQAGYFHLSGKKALDITEDFIKAIEEDVLDITLCRVMENISALFAVLDSKNLITTSEDILPQLIQNIVVNYDELFEDGILREIPLLRRHLQAAEVSKEDSLKWFSVSVASCEMSFSKLKSIKMSQARLSGLVIVSIENKIMKGTDFDDVISKFAENNVRKNQFEMLMLTIGAVAVTGELLIDAYAVESGLKVEGQLHSKSGVDVKIRGSEGKKLDVQVGMPMQTQELINFKSTVVSTVRERDGSEHDKELTFKTNRKGYHGCFDQLSNLVGLIFCSSGSVPWQDPITANTFYPFNGPASLLIQVEAKDVPYYHLVIEKDLHGQYEGVVKLLFDTPGSQTNRKLELSLTRVLEPQYNLAVNFISPRKILSASVYEVDNTQEYSWNAKFKYDEQEYSARVGAKKSGSESHQVYTPLLEYRTPAKSHQLSGSSTDKGFGCKVLRLYLSTLTRAFLSDIAQLGCSSRKQEAPSCKEEALCWEAKWLKDHFGKSLVGRPIMEMQGLFWKGRTGHLMCSLVGSHGLIYSQLSRVIGGYCSSSTMRRRCFTASIQHGARASLLAAVQADMEDYYYTEVAGSILDECADEH
ncbi:hypothetical protein PR048_008759 [Dryococelus australis]|uniref:Vitellinogen open beta-sheet domain-containing protein n=1 Tax=Dryococelus australis TaxID=614101 RepID=A0ABQ9HY13_9NEOP|nr:hypothetical protein PR048_008759 [Dryococelus australis]